MEANLMNFDALSSAQLVAAHNDLIGYVTQDDVPNVVKKFSDRATAVKRVSALLERVNSARAEAGSALVEIQEDGTIEVTKSEEAAPELPTEPASGTTEGPVLEAQAERVESEFHEVDPTLQYKVIQPDLDAKVGGSFEEFKAEAKRVQELNEAPEVTDTTNEAPEEVVPPTEPVVDKPKNVAKKNGAKNLGGRPPLVADTDIITMVHVGANPKRAAAAVRFGRYKSGMSVEEYAQAIGGDRRQALRDVAWDLKMKWISVAGAPKKAVTKDEPKTEGGAA